MDRDAREPFSPLLRRVDDGHRLAVAEPDDQIGAFPEVVEHVLGRTVLPGERSHYVGLSVVSSSTSPPLLCGRSPAPIPDPTVSAHLQGATESEGDRELCSPTTSTCCCRTAPPASRTSPRGLPNAADTPGHPENPR